MVNGLGAAAEVLISMIFSRFQSKIQSIDSPVSSGPCEDVKGRFDSYRNLGGCARLCGDD